MPNKQRIYANKNKKTTDYSDISGFFFRGLFVDAFVYYTEHSANLAFDRNDLFYEMEHNNTTTHHIHESIMAAFCSASHSFRSFSLSPRHLFTNML